VQVPRPLVVSTYNNNMGGTDLMDENINIYRISIRGKKWINIYGFNQYKNNSK
jgi:hypothetical protein